MGWKGVTMMDQRVRFIAEYLKGYFPSTVKRKGRLGAKQRPTLEVGENRVEDDWEQRSPTINHLWSRLISSHGYAFYLLLTTKHLTKKPFHFTNQQLKCPGGLNV